MDRDTFWAALALVLVFEGLMPFVSPSRWRAMFQQVMQLRDGQIRFFGLCCVASGMALLWWMA